MKEHLFNAKAKIYDIARPRYAQEMMDFLRDNEKLSNKNDIIAGINKNKPIIVPFEKSSNPITSLYKNTGNVINFPPIDNGTP